MEKFNQNLEQFLTNLVKITKDDSILNYYNFTQNTDEYLLNFYKNCNELGNDIANKDDIIFAEENVILQHVNFNKIWNIEDLTDDNRDIIWSYLQTLYIFAYEYVKEVDIKNVLNTFRDISLEDESVDIDTKNLLNIIYNLTDKYKDPNTEEAENATTNNNMSFNMPDIFNGTIGDLAKEIAEEIDPSQINLEDPSALLKDLLSGNFNEENDKSGIVNLVKNITSKIQDKIATGDINQNDLFSEAQNMMSNFSNNADGDMAGLGSIFSNLMGNMNGAQMGAAKTNFERTKNKTETKRRLKEKLEEKKRLLQEQEKILEDELNNIENPPLRDIDDLVNEIEGINASSAKKKIKKRKSKLNSQAKLL